MLSKAIPTLLLFSLLALQFKSGAQLTKTARCPAHWGLFEINSSKMIQPGKHARKRKHLLKPKFITVHSTVNVSRGANAERHAQAQRNGALKSTHNSLGYLSWHYTVDQSSIYRSLPDTEQGQHADYQGQGNRESIGIEMCVNRGNSAPQTIDRTAKLVALLMKRHGIPLANVVPHQHWKRIRFKDGKDLGYKNCPGLLLEDGKLKRKWANFKAAIQSYRRQL
ncbi:MAG: N-acetylmuramoyl-L-alanine amidase [Verrucomicrobiales bacterium]|nr:N-acetylmuramoyl-L-alanine amidase [Verrucomicrobiales bacterium]